MKRVTTILLFLCLVLTPMFADQASDDKIHDQVMLKLANDVVVKGANLEIDVKDGVVTLRGAVRLDKARERAEKLAHKVKGVKSVNNQLTVKVD